MQSVHMAAMAVKTEQNLDICQEKIVDDDMSKTHNLNRGRRDGRAVKTQEKQIMYQVNNKFAEHGRYTPAFCETFVSAVKVRAYIAHFIADLFSRFESDGEWEKTANGRRYNAPENGYCRVGDAAYWEWYDRVLDDVGDDGILPEDILTRHCLAAVEITETDHAE